MNAVGLDVNPLPCPLPGVQLWWIDLDQSLPAAARATLSADERARAARFHFEMHRHRFRVGRAALRQLLAAHLGLDAGALRLGTSEHGKPVLAPPHQALHFNLSHTGGGALFALTRTAPVGVDLEALREVDDAVELAQHNFTSAELAELQASPPAVRSRDFLRGWTRKEACLKAWGTGLSLSPRCFEAGLSAAPRRVAAPDPRLGGPLQLVSLALPHNDRHEAAVALGTAGGARD